MNLIERLEAELAVEQSYFRQHLIREDIARLNRLVALAGGHADEATFVAAGQTLGWTPDDRRTHELKPALVPLLEAIHRAGGDMSGAQIEALWRAFETLRMDRLVGCLSRVPRPA
jgi:hypothetical protein